MTSRRTVHTKKPFISSGLGHSAAVLESGDLVTWGTSRQLQLGQDIIKEKERRAEPEKVKDAMTLNRAKQLGMNCYFKAKLGRTQVTGSRARDKGWLIGRINGVPTIRAKRAQGKQGGGGGKRARAAK